MPGRAAAFLTTSCARGFAVSLALLGLVVVTPSAGAQTSSCLETGGGLYPGWRGLSYGERARRCIEAERTTDRAIILELQREQWRQSNPELRRQECLFNVAACDIPGPRSVAPPPFAVPPPPAPPPPPR